MRVVEVKDIAILDLEQHEQNAALRPGQDLKAHVAGLAKSIQEKGFMGAFPLIVVKGKTEGAKHKIVSGNCRYAACFSLIAGLALPRDFAVPCIVREYENEQELLSDLLMQNAIQDGESGYVAPPLHARVALALRIMQGQIARTKRALTVQPLTGPEIEVACGVASTNGGLREALRGFVNLSLLCDKPVIPTEKMFDGVTTGEVRRYLTAHIGNEKQPDGGLLVQYTDAVKVKNTERMKAILDEFRSQAESCPIAFPRAKLNIKGKVKQADTVEAKVKGTLHEMALRAPCTVFRDAIQGTKFDSTYYVLFDLCAKLSPAQAEDVANYLYATYPDAGFPVRSVPAPAPAPVKNGRTKK